MNHTFNDYGKSVTSVGMPGSDADIENRFPKAINRVLSFYKAHRYAEAFILIHKYLTQNVREKTDRIRIIEVAGLHVVYTFQWDD